ncbi:LamG-like jellyroll fold domain-containing protein [Microbacterium sp.]|uniref:LamG-like jellyroll fold domain-containing protein n=1 Tax=Microbacterium sp. TaxID=51671 RepID=UPI003F99BEEE
MTVDMIANPRRRGARGGIAVAAAFAIALSGVAVAAPAQAASDRPGLKAEYFTTGEDFALGELQSTVIDAAVDYQNLVPVYEQRTGRTEQVGARWSGDLHVPDDGEYVFDAIGDNGFRLWVDDELLIDHWVDDWDVRQTADPVDLTAGAHDFRFELFQNAGGAYIDLGWTGPGFERTTIPADAFTLPDSYDGVTADIRLDAGGTVAVADFGGALSGAIDATQFALTSDGYEIPIADAALAEGSLQVTADTPVQSGSVTRLAYDGDGSLALDGESVAPFDLPVVNGSEYTMRTPWAEDVDPEAPLPEYPRPQLQRDEWQNLNGTWQFEALEGDEAAPTGEAYSEEVVVPYPIESELSGIARHEDDFAYRRTFEVPADWKIGDGNRLMLQFGAVDYDSQILVNGTQIATHTGGYDAFSADATDALHEGVNELVVRVHDDTTNVVRGKQEVNPSGIFYTPSSGIWQTAWMEPVPESSVTELDVTPDLEESAFVVQTEGNDGVATTVTVSADGETVGQATGEGGEPIDVTVDDPRLWSPDDPFLYDIDISTGADTVRSYAGMRSIEISESGGTQRILLNGEQTFLLSTLDQGYWPDGVSTAPTDEALRWDIEQTKELGFNTIRKHIKVEPARWYHHADQLGMLVWQDMPSNNGGNQDDESRAAFESQLATMVDQMDSYTSVIGWVPFNEGWGEWDQQATGRIADEVGELDPTRIVNAHSGVNCCNSHGDSGRGDIIDWHMYVGPALPQPDENRASIDGEHGGFSLSVPGHVWPGGSVNPYGEVDSVEALTDSYVANTAKLLRPSRDFLSGSVYTQLTDVEGEVNGFWTYDRRVPKMDFDRVAEINARVIAYGSGTPVPDDPDADGEGFAHWSMDEGEGSTSADLTENGSTLQLGDGVTWTEQRESAGDGSAIVFDGGQQATAQVDGVDGTDSYSISTWVRLDELPDSGYVTFASADGLDESSSFFLQYGADIGGFAMSFPDGPRAVAEIVPEPGVWYHLVGVRDAQDEKLALYVDGEQASTVEAKGATGATGAIALGRAEWEGDDVDFLTGALDDVHVFGLPLDDAQVARLYEEESSADDDPDEIVSTEAAATVAKTPGPTNELTIVVTETHADGSETTQEATHTIGNNATGTYDVGDYRVYVETKGNTKIRDIQIVE